MKKAAIYCRVSSDEQVDRDLSLPAQRKLLHEYALKNGYTITHEFIEEGKSARSDKRPEFQAMIALARTKPKPFDAVIIHKTDRFARNRQDAVTYKSVLRRDCNIEVLFAAENFDDGPMGQMVEGVMEVLAEFYSANLSVEVRKGMTEAASRGRALGMAPIGYSVVNGYFEIVPEESALVSWIFNEYANTSKGTRELAKILRVDGKRLFGEAGVKHKWSQNGIAKILRNRCYTGDLIWNMRDGNNKHEIRPEDEWIIAEDAHEAIVSKELFEAVQEQLNKKKQSRSNSEDYLLKGLVRCMNCGSAMSQFNVSWKRKSGEVIKGDKKFVCNHYRNTGQCSTNTVSSAELETAVKDFLIKVSQGKINVSDINIKFTEDNTTKQRVSDLKSKLKSFDNRFERQMEAFEAGIISIDELKTFKERLEKEKEVAEQELNQLVDVSEKLSHGYSVIKGKISEALTSLESEHKTLQEKKKALSYVVEYIEYSREQDLLNIVLKA